MAKRSSANTATGEIEMPDDSQELEIPSRRHEILGVLATVFALVLLLSLVSYDGMAPEGGPLPDGNIIGPGGVWTAFVFFSLFGAASYMVNLFMWIYAACLFTGQVARIGIKGIIGTGVIALLSAIAIQTMLQETTIAGGHAPGGLIGLVLGQLLISVFSTAGTYIIAFGGILVTLLVVTDISLFLLGRTVGIGLVTLARYGGDFAMRVIRAWRDELPGDGDDSVELEEPQDATDIAIVKSPAKKSRNAKKESPVEEASANTQENDAVSAPRIVTTVKPQTKKPTGSDDIESLSVVHTVKGEFHLPSLSMLKLADGPSSNVDERQLQDTANRLVKVLADFGISGEVREIRPGPSVTMFEFQPKTGTKLSRISGLSSEIAMALEATRVRVVAPIPGKNAVGFEMPNREREMVRLREILQDEKFFNTRYKLPMALGKDISGLPYVADLAKMPHLLMAGTTGSGKSVSVNTMLLSLLYKYTPDELRLLLIDPKMIEFQPYNHIPHLLLPVVTDMSQACLALKWAVDEMERRYQLFADMGGAVKNLESYNRKVAKILADAEEKERNRPSIENTAVTAEGVVVEFGEADPIPAKLPERLPLIVICIDELADLMMVAAKDVETSIARLAQKARAAGLHLIVATQRPSTDVVTGLIKANFPSRLSCKVSSGIDSRTILGSNGAESLLGNGDMLILPPGSSDLQRVQGAFVSEEEVSEIVDFLKKQGAPTYDEEILAPREEDGSSDVDDGEKDEVYDQAVAIVAEAQSCSISMLQRKLRIGYNRSARIVEIMEKEGVVGPPNGVNKREVLISQL